MKKYKADYYNPVAFERTEIETNLPTDLVEVVRNCVDDIDNYLVTPAMINPEDKSVVFGVMDLTDKTLKYKITIS